MGEPSVYSRRTLIKSSLLGAMAVSFPHLMYAGSTVSTHTHMSERPHDNYPSISPDIVSEIVGVSHFNLVRLKELVDPRPELARATWDWAFGDWESAIGAASHVGRKDIVAYLMQQGARPTIFTFAMLGAYDVVKSMIEFSPGIQRTLGPHGYSLLQHVEFGMRDVGKNRTNYDRLLDYLQRLGDAGGPQYPELLDDEKEHYLGDYKYGDGEEDGFSVRLNMRKMITLGRIGQFGGALFKLGEDKFTYNGAPSVQVTFRRNENTITALTVHEPGYMLHAEKVS